MSSRTFALMFRLLLAGLILVNLLNTTVLDLPRLTLVTNILLVLVAFFFFVRLLKNYQNKKSRESIPLSGIGFTVFVVTDSILRLDSPGSALS